MRATKFAISMACTAALLFAGCATSPEVERQREAKEADIAAILKVKLDPAEFGETQRCLSESQYRSFRPLDENRILFTGTRDKLWINTLRSRCMDLRHGDVLIGLVPMAVVPTHTLALGQPLGNRTNVHARLVPASNKGTGCRD
jgi:hypothetical protein